MYAAPYFTRLNCTGGNFSFRVSGGEDREIIKGDLGRLPLVISKIIFVLTIHEALERGLNISMLERPYIRFLDAQGGELASYCPEELYSGVTSMTLGEVYRYKGEWRFNAVGNGVKQDLAGQCALYGVHTV